MTGRWTILSVGTPTKQGPANAVVTGPRFTGPPVPVVPVDDAAVERAARAIDSMNTFSGARKLAEAALRAAGEVS
jgi:hypothetical protein